MTRDRADGYAPGIQNSVPDARQMADRWHLLKNLTEALAKVFQDHDRAIRAVSITPEKVEAMATNQLCDATTVPAISTPPEVAALTPVEQRRHAHTQQADALHAAGCTYRDIAHQPHCRPKTIRRDLHWQLP